MSFVERERNEIGQFVEGEVIPFAIRFWARVEKRGADECWPWQDKLTTTGYGRFDVKTPRRRSLKAHRVAFELTFGKPTACVCHRCDNPICCNPKHLFLGTQLDNIADMVAKGRAAKGEKNGTRKHPESLLRGEDQHAAVLTSAKVVEIRNRYREGGITQQSLAEEFGVTRASISDVICGRTWRHVQ